MCGKISSTVQIPLHQIKTKFYSLRDKISNCLSTDQKIYSLVILGRALQIAALAGLAASLLFTFSVGPLALCGLIPSALSFTLGTYLAKPIASPPNAAGGSALANPTPPAPFIPGQPIGLNNTGNNCWLNSGLQLLSNIPSFEPRIRHIPLFSQFLDRYKQTRDASQKIVPNFDTAQIRTLLHEQSHGVILNGREQEDAAELFKFLFQFERGYLFEYQLNGYASNPHHEPLIPLQLVKEEANPNLPELMNSFFDHRSEDHQRHERFFATAPQDLLIQLQRFHRDPSGIETKISNLVKVPEHFTLPHQHIRAQGADIPYECDAFIVHLGSTIAYGHYVCYLKREGRWWRCSDSSVEPISKEHAIEAMKDSYIVHYSTNLGI